MDQIDAGPTAEVVRELLEQQVPHLRGEQVRPSEQSGSSNWVWRVGERHAVRLPRNDSYVADLRNEVQWLPRLAPHLSAPVPDVVFAGRATDSFPRQWAVVSWVPGVTPGVLDAAAQRRLAATLGEFAQSLHAIDTFGLEAGAARWGYRAGEPVTDTIDQWADEVADDLGDIFDPAQIREAWRRLREVPGPSTPPCWVHTDLAAENILVEADGATTGVVDFGGLGIGDQSVDLLYAWSMFHAPAREIFRAAAGADEATWLRARAWAFIGPGLMTIDGYRDTMPERTARLTTMVEAVAGEVGVQLR